MCEWLSVELRSFSVRADHFDSNNEQWQWSQWRRRWWNALMDLSFLFNRLLTHKNNELKCDVPHQNTSGLTSFHFECMHRPTQDSQWRDSCHCRHHRANDTPKWKKGVEYFMTSLYFGILCALRCACIVFVYTIRQLTVHFHSFHSSFYVE